MRRLPRLPLRFVTLGVLRSSASGRHLGSGGVQRIGTDLRVRVRRRADPTRGNLSRRAVPGDSQPLARILHHEDTEGTEREKSGIIGCRYRSWPLRRGATDVGDRHAPQVLFSVSAVPPWCFVW
jgi:hypothetical protein